MSKHGSNYTKVDHCSRGQNYKPYKVWHGSKARFLTEINNYQKLNKGQCNK